MREETTDCISAGQAPVYVTADVRLALGRVRDEVLEATGSRQEPYLYGSLGGSEVAIIPAINKHETELGSSANPMRRDYELATQVGSKEVWNSFLAQYSTGFYANLARAQLAKLEMPNVESTIMVQTRPELVPAPSKQQATLPTKEPVVVPKFDRPHITKKITEKVRAQSTVRVERDRAPVIHSKPVEVRRLVDAHRTPIRGPRESTNVVRFQQRNFGSSSSGGGSGASAMLGI